MNGNAVIRLVWADQQLVRLCVAHDQYVASTQVVLRTFDQISAAAREKVEYFHTLMGVHGKAIRRRMLVQCVVDEQIFVPIIEM